MTKVKYNDDYNPVLEYWDAIESGKEIVSHKIYVMYKYLAHLINHPGEYFYSAKRANHILEFAENYCKLSKGAGAGKPVRLELWEKAMLAAVFGIIDINGNRLCREALLIVGKKDGKSLLSSIVVLYLVLVDGSLGP